MKEEVEKLEGLVGGFQPLWYEVRVEEFQKEPVKPVLEVVEKE